VLSALAHGPWPDGGEVLRALPAALVSVDDQHAKLYYDLVLSALPSAARRHLEELMTTTYEYQSDFARKYVAEGEAIGRAEGEAVGRAEGEAVGRAEGEAVGRAEGEAVALLTVLAARGIDIPADARARIAGCTDIDQLTTWLRRAATADTIDDVLS
jgi:hypothetical protein